MKNKSIWIKCIIICVAIAAVTGYFLLDHNMNYCDNTDTDIEKLIYRQMRKRDRSADSIHIFSTQEVDVFRFVAFEYSSDTGRKLACATFTPSDSGKLKLCDLTLGKKFYKYTMGIFEKIADFTIADSDRTYSYRLILIDREDLSEIISIDKYGDIQRFNISNTPCLIILTNVHTQRQFVDIHGKILPAC